ncbi:RTA1 domain-containing protein [Aspergillus fijiensis CBS 313.89]|uniref:Putative RTA1 domain protein n=1 Tax=Aspergillus fijiensis CBS 313.89 TaxID=1448319 RepID=A0A8G1VZS8_9EURO|nr:putative RTA1 domain protein [Aspergillus fijiensis CBS 313.89]RAK75334.1 putative RTA1 domain protein [Aspergillus fijiensis CBS 313.89]
MPEIVRRSYTFWYYTPSLAAAVIFMIIFMGLTGLHSRKMFATRTWFCIAFTLGGLFEIIGYIGRAIAHSNTTTMGPYILANIFILLAPTLFAASIYMTLGRLIRRIGAEHLSVIRVSRLTKTFVWGDVLSFIVQGNSSSLSVLGYAQWGKVCVIVGLAIQLISFSIFWISAIVFERRIRRNPTPESLQPGIPWKKTLYMLYAVSALIMIRSIFRIIEYVLGNSGYPLQHEWTMYILDSVPMAIVMIIYLTWYPSGIKAKTDIEASIPLGHVYSKV